MRWRAPARAGRRARARARGGRPDAGRARGAQGIWERQIIRARDELGLVAFNDAGAEPEQAMLDCLPPDLEVRHARPGRRLRGRGRCDARLAQTRASSPSGRCSAAYQPGSQCRRARTGAASTTQNSLHVHARSVETCWKAAGGAAPGAAATAEARLQRERGHAFLGADGEPAARARHTWTLPTCWRRASAGCARAARCWPGRSTCASSHRTRPARPAPPRRPPRPAARPAAPQVRAAGRRQGPSRPALRPPPRGRDRRPPRLLAARSRRAPRPAATAPLRPWRWQRRRERPRPAARPQASPPEAARLRSRRWTRRARPPRAPLPARQRWAPTTPQPPRQARQQLQARLGAQHARPRSLRRRRGRRPLGRRPALHLSPRTVARVRRGRRRPLLSRGSAMPWRNPACSRSQRSACRTAGRPPAPPQETAWCRRVLPSGRGLRAARQGVRRLSALQRSPQRTPLLWLCHIARQGSPSLRRPPRLRRRPLQRRRQARWCCTAAPPRPARPRRRCPPVPHAPL